MSIFAMHTIGMYSLHHAFGLPLERMVTLLGSMQSPRVSPVSIGYGFANLLLFCHIRQFSDSKS